MSPTLSPDWRQWIELNLQRQCTLHSMIEAMVAKDFDPATAAAFVATVAGDLQRRALTASPPPSAEPAYQYEPSRLPQAASLPTLDRIVTVRMRLERPEILLFGGLLSGEECDELVHRAQAKLAPSTTVDRATGEARTIPDRSSSGTYFALEEDPFIARIDRRLAELAHWPLDHAEGLQILHYRVGGQYKPHFDYFPPEDLGSAAHTAQGGQRVATIVMYLNDVSQGGETIFPELSLAIAPQKGDAVYFAYTNSLGQVDRRTLHGGAPVVQGEKWIATKWLRQHRRR